jgi:hypothetical protein
VESARQQLRNEPGPNRFASHFPLADCDLALTPIFSIHKITTQKKLMTTETQALPEASAAAPPAPMSLMARLGTVPVGARGIQLANMDDIFRFARAIALSQLCPPGFSETDCFVIIANGLEVGMSPMAALASTYVVNNRATIFGDMPLALVRQSGLLESYSQKYEGKKFDDDYRCVVTTKRKGEEPIATSYSVADAKLAEVWGKTVTKNGKEFKTPWVTAPDRMLLFRARGFNLRDNFGDVLKGCAIAELNDDENQAGFEHAKAAAARVVEPNFDGAAAPQAAGISEERLSAALEHPTIAPEAPRRRGRPSKTDRQPDTLFPPAAPPAPASASEPVTPPAPAPPPPISPPPEPKSVETNAQPGPVAEILKRLAAEKISQEAFLLLMHELGLVDAEREDITMGYVTIGKVKEHDLNLALGDWPRVVETLKKAAKK